MRGHGAPVKGPPESVGNPGVEQEETPPMDAERVLEMLGDEYTRRVLRAVTEQPRTGPEIAEALDMSKATVYRRLERLEEANVVASTRKLDPKGHHCQQFHAVVSGFEFEFGRDGMDVSVRTNDRSDDSRSLHFIADD